MMKIGILIDQLVPGGVQKVAIEEAKALLRKGHQVTLLVIMRKRYNYQYEDICKDLKVEFIADYFPRWLRRPIKFPIFHFLTTLHLISPFLVKRLLPKLDYDFLISHATTTCFTAQAIKRSQGLSYAAFIWDPMVYILKKVYRKTALRSIFFILEPVLKKLESSFLKDALVIFTSVKVHSDYIKQNYNLDSYRIYAGVYPAERVFEPKEDFILACTRWDKDKNPSFLLELIRSIPEAKLVMAGSWTNEQDQNCLLEQIKKKGLESRVTVFNYLDEKKLKDMLDRARVFIHVNFEAFGMGGLEAAARGCPFIIPRGSGVTELFEDGRHGYFPETGNFAGFRNALVSLVENKDLAYVMGLAAYQRAKNYTWEWHAEKVLGLIKENISKDCSALERGNN